MDGAWRRPCTSLAKAVVLVAVLVACGPGPMAIRSPVGQPSLAPIATLKPIPSATARLTPVGAAANLAIAPLAQAEIARFERLELEVQADIVPSNPFDPDELDIRVEFTSPSGETVDVGAFWYQEYQPPGILRRGEPSWRVRFTPTEIGAWTAVARIPAHGTESEPVDFRVTPSESHGFVRIHPQDPRYLAFDDGSFFFPIGVNMGWWTGAGTAQGDYGKWMDAFAANGGDTIRVWMAEWSFGLEWNDTGLGDYSRRLGKAWLLDQIFRMAEERDVYIILVLLNCADFNNWQTNGWANNPYNADRGGPLERPEDFATHPEARALLQRKLNYIVNRWGYSPNLLAWEWWNEVNLTPISDEALIPWLQEMTAYLRARDVNRHLTTNSYAIKYLSPTWQLPELDIIQRHEYATQVNSPDRDFAGRAAEDYRSLSQSAPPKPILLGEFGYGAEATADDIERTGIHLHNGLWSTTFVGYAGSGMYWYWDVYLDAYRQWRHFGPLQRFLTDEDLTKYEPFSPLRVSDGQGRPATVDGLGLRGDKTLVWMRSDAYTVDASVAAWMSAGSPKSFAYSPPLLEGLVLTLGDVRDGQYLVRWYDPQAGKWLDEHLATADGGRLSILAPAFRRDLAAKVVPIE
jgi:hypothetical protein